MKSPARIVVGVDGSAASLDALRWAARQSALTGQRLDAVISWRYPTQYGNEFAVETMDYAELAGVILADAVRGAGLDAQPVSCTQTVTEGHPAQVLTDASVDADLLVVGSRGHGGFVGLLVGSVSEYVIAHAGCPVVVIRQHAAEAAPRDAPLLTIVQ